MRRSGAAFATDYCSYLEATAAAEGALLAAPEVFARAGNALIADSHSPSSTVVLDSRFRGSFGVEYRLSDLYRSVLLKRRAAAECRGYRAASALELWTRNIETMGQHRALARMEAVLDGNMAQARAEVTRIRDLARAGFVTDSDLFAAELRMRQMRALLNDTRREQRRLAALVAGIDGPPAQPAETLVTTLVASTQRAQSLASSLRRSRSWQLSVAAGADSLQGASQRFAPFVQAQFTFNIGALWQGSANRRAEDAHLRWRRAEPDSAENRLVQIRDSLVSAYEIATEELEQTTQMHNRVRERLAVVSQASSERSHLYRTELWFSDKEMTAKIAYLDTYCRELHRLVQSAFGPSKLAGTALAQAPEELPVGPAPVGPAPVAAASAPVGLRISQGQIAPIPTPISMLAQPDMPSTNWHRIEVPAMRALRTDSAGGNRGSVTFIYRGRTARDVSLASGQRRRQIGIKLRAQDSCNVLYVMWHLHPTTGLEVTAKHNPEQHSHAQCGANGYRRIESDWHTSLPEVEIGRPHQLRAHLHGRVLQVTVDGQPVWRGTVPPWVLSFSGPAGIRSDNARFDVHVGD